MMLGMKKVLVTAMMLLIVVSVSNATTLIWLSDKGLGEGSETGAVSPDLTMDDGTSDTLYVWIRPDQRLVGAGLNVEVTNAATIEGTSVNVEEANITAPGMGDFYLGARWDTPVNDGTAGDLMEGTPVGAAVTEKGIDPQYGQNSMGGLDKKYDSGKQAFLYATIDFDATAVGSTELYIVVNTKRVAPDAGEDANNPLTSADLDILFGASETTTLHGNSEYIRSAVLDGKVTVIPEPVTIGLVAVGGLGLLARKRR